jgi:hypothetical protein
MSFNVLHSHASQDVDQTGLFKYIFPKPTNAKVKT